MHGQQHALTLHLRALHPHTKLYSRWASSRYGTSTAAELLRWRDPAHMALDTPALSCRMRATALEKGLNVILNPILDCVEQLLTRGCLLGSCQVSDMLEFPCSNVYDKNPSECEAIC